MKKIIGFVVCVLLMALLFTLGASAEVEQAAEFHSILENAVEHEGNYYLFINAEVTWEQAQAFCEALGGHLATITTEQENAVCTQIWLSANVGFCWLGASDVALESDWKWVTGETWIYEDFADGDPNGGTWQNYLTFWPEGQNGYWADEGAQCLPFICEWEAADVESVRKNYGYFTGASVIFKDALYWNGHVYKAFSHNLIFADAMEYCEALGGHLATITSAEENTVCVQLWYALNVTFCWLGGTDSEQEDNWKWITGESWVYDDFADGEPNEGVSANFLNFWGNGQNGTWADERDRENPFICEWENLCMGNGTVSTTHRYGEGTVLQEATCAAPGRVQKTCETCGHTIEEETPVLTHVFGEWAIAKEPTCHLEGTNARTCTLCGQKEEQSLPTLTHVFGEWATAKEPTCHLEGTNARTCTLCGQKEEQSLPTLTHIYGEWTVVSGSKLIPPIVKEKTCTLCGDAQSEKDWSFVWIPIVVAVVIIGLAIGVINYFRAFRKK